MPEQSYPPYADGAKTVPRQLNRWLDVNPQNGALRRCGTTLTIPAFTTTATWDNVPDIVAAFNYEAPNNFSLYNIPSPESPNYTMCISYRVDNTVTRYRLWGDSINVAPDLYNGETIKKNFRIEVWQNSSTSPSDTNSYTLTTSVLKGIDYRFGTDSALAGNDGQVSDFAVSSRIPLPPELDDVVGIFYGFYNNTVPSPSWIAYYDTEDNYGPLISSSGFNLNTSDDNTETINGVLYKCVLTHENLDAGDLGYLSATSKRIPSSTDIIDACWIVLRAGLWGGEIVTWYNHTAGYSTGHSISVNASGQLCWSSQPGSSHWTPLSPSVTLGTSDHYFLKYQQTSTGYNIALYDTELNNLGQWTITHAGVTNRDSVAIGSLTTSARASFVEVLFYTNYSGYYDLEMLDYFDIKYLHTSTQFGLPLTFPSTSVSTTN